MKFITPRLVTGCGLAAISLLFGVSRLGAAPIETVELAGFESSDPKFTGALSVDKSVAHAGSGSGRITGDFSDPEKGAWVTAKIPLDLRNPLKVVSFWAKTSDALKLTVRIDDSTNQVHQVRPSIVPDGRWQKITINSFETGPGRQSYGGAADGIVHWPARQLCLILEKNGLVVGNTGGTVWVDQVEAQVEGAPLPLEPSFDEMAKTGDLRTVADFEGGLSGFSGAIQHSRESPRGGGGAARMKADFTGVTEGAWITATRHLSEYKAEIKALRFWARSKEATRLTVRLVDSTGQNLQLRPKIRNDGGWHPVVITNFGDQPGREIFGGAGDKVMHWPARSLSFILEKNGLANGAGGVDIDDVEIVFDKDRIVGALDLLQGRPGNIFAQGEEVVVPVDTQASSVRWAVRDFAGRTLWEGVSPVRDKTAFIKPPVDRVGYFEMTLEAGDARRETTLAVLPPFDLASVSASPFGVMTHFAQGWDVDVMPLIAKAGIKHIRDELYWDSVERTKGAYAMEPKFESYLREAESLHLEPLLALTFGNRHYDSTPDMPSFGNAPFSDEGRDAYSRYGNEVIKHYGEQLQAVEIWNEYNGTFGRGPVEADRAHYYFEMLKNSYAALKKARPDLTVVGISAVATPFPYFEDLFKKGALNYMDALSLHPYRTQGTPEGLEKLMGKLNARIHAHSPDREVPIWITELGWYVKPPGGGSDLVVTEADQAKYLVRAITLTLSAGVERFYWYHARDDTAFPSSGLLRGPADAKGRYAPKPSYVAYAILARQLNDARFVRREPTLDEDTYCLLFEREGEPVRVVWSLAPATLPVQSTESLSVVDLVGGSATVAPKAGVVEVSLSDAPVYIVGRIDALPPEIKAPGVIVADSELDFSSEQGDNGWSYGYYIKTGEGAPYHAASWRPLPNYKVTIWGYEWVGAQPFLTLTPGEAHPSVEDGRPVWAMRRWTSNVEGKVRIQGKFGHADRGDGTEGIIFIDGVEIWRSPIGGTHPGRVKYDVSAKVAQGSRVDIAITPGPGGDISYDATSSTSRIRLMP